MIMRSSPSNASTSRPTIHVFKPCEPQVPETGTGALQQEPPPWALLAWLVPQFAKSFLGSPYEQRLGLQHDFSSSVP